MTREEAINYAEAIKAKTQDKIEFYRRGNAHAPEVYYSDLAFLSAAISALREQEERRWITVTERLPDLELVDAKNDDFDLYACLVTVKNFRAKNGRYVKKAWYDGEIFMDENCADITDKVTHWMPLPEPPKEGA